MQVVGYYALAAGEVARDEAPSRIVAGTGQYPIPVILLARLGVDHSAQGTGLGRALVMDAIRRVAGIAEDVGIRALLIHAENEEARSFYLHLATFEPSPTDPFHLLLLMKDARRAINSGA
jgi:GNAT superfamily N-acetyltransferase